MSLLDKFATVEIKSDNRISEEDREYCLQQQEAFDKSGPLLAKIAALMTEGLEEQKAIMKTDKDFPAIRYICGNGFTFDVDRIYGAMIERNSTFISTIVHYFSDKYKVELDASAITKHVLPAPPEKPNTNGIRYERLSDEDLSNLEERTKAYQQEKEKYDISLRTLPIRYEQIVDEIFVQLGGFSFQEQAMNEFLERTWNCCHQEWDAKEKFEIKNNTLRLPKYWCTCEDSWWLGPQWQSSDDLRTLLDALAWYYCGRMGEGHLWFPELFECLISKNEFEIHNMSKIKSIKLFKNGRVDIKFENAACVQEFVEQCMRRKTEK